MYRFLVFKNSVLTVILVTAGLSSLIACSPTRFTQTNTAQTLCGANTATQNCINQNGNITVTEEFTVGAGKVDILFVNDNSASMSKIQTQLKNKFSGFIQNLDSRKIDYRIAMTTTDLNTVSQSRLLSFPSGSKILTSSNSNRVSEFNNTIVRAETIACENFISSMFSSYGPSFQTQSSYSSQYYSKCPSPDTRGIYTANLVLSENTSSFVRSDASLSIILISNDNVRQGTKALEEKDKSSTFISMMNQVYPNKYWDFNSIVVGDETCKQSQQLRTSSGQVIVNELGSAVVNGGLGYEYAALSVSAAKTLEGAARKRGKVLDLCQSDYAQHFNSMVAQITESMRAYTMKCVPQEKPEVVMAEGQISGIAHTWSGNKIIFQAGSEGKKVKIHYSCYAGPT